MRRLLYSILTSLILTALFGSFASYAQESLPSKWTLPDNPPVWGRNANELSASQETIDGIKATRLIYQGATDWAIRLPQAIDARPGQLFTLKAKIKNVGKGNCETGVVLYDEKGEALKWSYGGANARLVNDWQEITSKFIVPTGVVKIQPRIIGNGPSDVYVDSYEIEAVGNVDIAPIKGTLPAENEFLHVVFHMETAAFSIRDVRTGRVWRQTLAGNSLLVLGAEPIERGMNFHLLDPSALIEFDATIQLEKDKPELTVRISADPDLELPNAIPYPYPFQSRATDRIVLPVNEGISFPAIENAYGANRLYTYGGHGLCMAFWAIVHDSIDASKSDGLMGIIESPDDAIVETNLRAVEPADKDVVQNDVKTLAIGHLWQNTKKTFGYNRTLRIIALDKGGYVAACKRYREYAKEIGLYVTFDQKIERNPKLAKGIDLLLGAANIWCWDGGGTEIVPQLKAAGFDRILWSGGGSPQVLEELNEMEGVLTSRYDIYQDIMDPSRYPELSHIHGDWIPEAWPQDLVWADADGTWTRGWEVDPKDQTKPRIPCGVLCDLTAVQYAKARIGKELEKSPYRARFLDTTVASPWRECWNPNHPMTRTDCKNARMELLGLLGKEFNLVCGSETGIDASVPFCDFYEGMTSLGPYRCPDSGRYLSKIWDEVPENVEKYQFGEKYRLPLFELVYHGCVVSYWYWGDHNNKFPKMWRKRDLFNALYGTPPMYGFKKEFFKENRERFEESYKIAQPVSRLTGRSPMEDHRILTEDRTVQKTSYANGVQTIVNFGDKEYRGEDGLVVPAMDYKILLP